jgi:hypothetical protein
MVKLANTPIIRFKKDKKAKKDPHRPDAIRQRDANFQFSKTNNMKTENSRRFAK